MPSELSKGERYKILTSQNGLGHEYRNQLFAFYPKSTKQITVVTNAFQGTPPPLLVIKKILL